MNSSDLIMRGDALGAIHRAKSGLTLIFGGSRHEDWSVSGPAAVSNINAIPAAEQPMSAVEYARNFGRMCKSHICRECAFRTSERFSRASCVAFEAEYPEEAVAIVQKWAQEHPEGSEV